MKLHLPALALSALILAACGSDSEPGNGSPDSGMTGGDVSSGGGTVTTGGMVTGGDATGGDVSSGGGSDATGGAQVGSCGTCADGAACVAGACACSAGFIDVNGDASVCEAECTGDDCNTEIPCGGCGTGAECVAGACTCRTGFNDVNGDASLCEADCGGALTCVDCDPAIPITGAVVSDTLWRGDLCVLLQEVRVSSNATLSVAPGTLLKAGHPNRADLNGTGSISVEGALYIDGEAQAPVIMTSYYDDTRSGDTDQSAAPAIARPGQHGGIKFLNQSRGRIKNAEIHYAENAVWSEASDPILHGVQVTNSSGAALSCLATDHPWLSQVELEKNSQNGLQRRSGAITEDTHWDQTAVVQILSGETTIAAGATLTIEQGVTIKSSHPTRDDLRNYYPLVVEGSLVAKGSDAQPIVFTSLYDDTKGGDTNNDVGNSTSANGQFGGLRFRPASQGDLDHVEIYYASDAVHTEGADPKLGTLKVRNCSGAAITTLPADQVEVTALDSVGCPINGLLRRSGVISQDTVWDQAAAVHVLGGTVQVATDVTLTVEQGVIVKGAHLTRPDLNGYNPLEVSGTLDLHGSETSPVTFTSFYDDARGGDTNGDAGATSARAGQFGGIVFGQGAGGTLTHAQMHYATSAMHLTSAKPDIDNVQVTECSVAAINAQASDEFGATGIAASGCPINGILRRAGTIGQDTTWDQTDIAQVLSGEVVVAADKTLTIAEGVVVKSGNQARPDLNGYFPITVSGQLDVAGTASNPVLFTSIHDDSAIGDTNGNGSSTSQRAGQTGGIRFSVNSSGTISYAEIRNALVAVSASSAVTLSDCELSLNLTGVAAQPGGEITIERGAIAGNTAGATATGTGTVASSDTWWGAADGPSGVGTGTGDSVTAGVTYTPFATLAP